VAPTQNVEVENRSKLEVFTPQGQHDEPISVKFGDELQTMDLLSHAKFGAIRKRAGYSGPKIQKLVKVAVCGVFRSTT